MQRKFSFLEWRIFCQIEDAICKLNFAIFRVSWFFCSQKVQGLDAFDLHVIKNFSLLQICKKFSLPYKTSKLYFIKAAADPSQVALLLLPDTFARNSLAIISETTQSMQQLAGSTSHKDKNCFFVFLLPSIYISGSAPTSLLDFISLMISRRRRWTMNVSKKLHLKILC